MENGQMGQKIKGLNWLRVFSTEKFACNLGCHSQLKGEG
jgi:hypothetical protein